jgi:ligand-binding SRPBCC domain-containing protein
MVGWSGWNGEELIELERRIAAPVERCFLLSLSMDLHLESTAQTGEKAIAGVTHGVIGPGESVTWRGRHFGLMLTHTSVISGYERPGFFEDSMTRGMFRSFAHRHYFTADGDGTVMRDELRFAAPLGVLGLIAERMVLRQYLRGFLEERNAVIQRVAESADGWVRYIG